MKYPLAAALAVLALFSADVQAQAPGGGASSSPPTARTQVQSFSSSWVDAFGICRGAITNKPSDTPMEAWVNGGEHAQTVALAASVYAPAGGSCGVLSALPTVVWKDALNRRNGDNSLAAANALKNIPGFQTPPGSTGDLSSGTVGPSNDPKAQLESDYFDDLGIHHKIITRQKWSGESLEQLAVRHGAAVQAMVAVFPPASPPD